MVYSSRSWWIAKSPTLHELFIGVSVVGIEKDLIFFSIHDIIDLTIFRREAIFPKTNFLMTKKMEAIK